MDDVLSLLKSCTEPWLSFGSEYLGAVPSFILLNVVGLLLLYLCYLLLPTKHRSRAKRRRKGGTHRGCRSHRREAEKKKLLNILKRPLGHHHDSTHFRHMLCPDPSCEVCNRTTAEIQQLLSQESLQDAALSEYFSSSTDSMIETSVCLTSDLSTIPPGDATAFPLAERSPPPCSTVSTNLDTSCEDFISPSNLGDSLPPELPPCLDFSFPGDHLPSQPLALPIPPPPSSQETDPVFQADITVTLGDSLGLVSTHEPKTKDASSTNLAALEIWNQTRAKSLSTSNLAQGDAKKNILGLCPSKISSGVASAPNLVGAHNLLYVSPDALVLLERQVRKRGDFLTHKERVKETEYFLNPPRPDLPLQSPGKMLESIHDNKYDSAVSLPFWRSKDKPFRLHKHQQPTCPATSAGHLRKKYFQLPWGGPVRHHDFLYPAGVYSSTLVVFSSMYDTSTSQESATVSHPQTEEFPAHSDVQAHESPELFDDQTQEYLELPAPQTQVSPALSAPQTQESPALADVQAQETPALADVQAQESPALADVQTQESPALVSQAQESQTFLVTQTQGSLAFSDSKPLLESEIQSQSLPQDMPQLQSQLFTQNQPQYSVSILPPYLFPQINTTNEFLNEAESLIPSEMEHLEHHMLKKKQENLWGIPTVVHKSQKDFCPPAPNFPLESQSCKAHIPVSILPGDFALSSELREKLEHHLLKRLIQHQWDLPCKVLESLFLINPQTDSLDSPRSRSNQGPSENSLFKGQKNKDSVDLRLNPPGSFYKKNFGMFPLEKYMGKSQGPMLECGSRDYQKSDSEKSSDMGIQSDSEEDLECQGLHLSGNNSRASWMSLSEKQLANGPTPARMGKKVKEIKECPIHKTVHGFHHSARKTSPLHEKSHSRVKQKELAPLKTLFQR
ncbi:spermatogenesis-associated protein 31D4-like [Ochotona princeps]|uniref:spermatogenesis-associated protein 31D4-like n=1 Tax=Ochotona princeps TaxID=9978 RepID=UPI0027151863|nr:spermatogenesis-associated protein 31D4-like [Ochotona princeps]